MKLIHAIVLLGLGVVSMPSFAQEKKKKIIIIIGSDAVKITKSDSIGEEMKREEKPFEIQVPMIEIGINGIRDQTDYSSPSARNFLQLPADRQNDNLFSLKNSKSINVNIYPVLARLRILKTEHQKIYLSTGVGLQMYNFRFN